ncbi:hypothetical protein [Jeotgalibacillus campisalis]|uniref:Uncharacterized protein n=1 Tax=Jeotgalibacillus campisalis TaxID=220754 RepID=A0A0C2W540_9BACL|nr:hypothetical protein [Jeotgalibacillus campisalis]KIL51133.1 hypothetical protein KR50_10140 [Jeotgalibacillus campisalis]
MKKYDEQFLFQRDLNRLKKMRSTITGESRFSIMVDAQISLLTKSLRSIH